MANKSVTKCSDGGIIVSISSNSPVGTGNIDSFCNIGGSRNIFFKYNADASVLQWNKCSTDGSFIFPQADGSFIFGGISTAVPSGWAFKITKQNVAGSTVWQKTYGGDSASAILRDMIATPDGGYIMLGETNYSDSDFTVHYGGWVYADLAVLKVDSNGNKVWSKVIGGTEDEIAHSVVIAPDGGCYIIATTYSTDFDCIDNHGGNDIYLARLDKNGNFVWHKLIGGTGGENGRSAATNDKGGVLIVGASNSTDGDRTHFPSFGCPIWALEVDSNSNIIWNKCFGGGGGNCYGNSICKAVDGSIWIAGVSNTLGNEVDSSFGHDDAFFVHADNFGNFVNAKVLGSHLDDRGTMIFPLANGNIIAGGFFDTLGGSFSQTWYGGSDAFFAIFAPWSVGLAQQQMEHREITIFPNPVIGKVKLVSAFTENYDVCVTNILGATVYRSNFTSHISIATDEWTKGMYLVRITNNSGFIDIQKLIVQ